VFTAFEMTGQLSLGEYISFFFLNSLTYKIGIQLDLPKRVGFSFKYSTNNAWIMANTQSKVFAKVFVKTGNI
jgi:hypothetical protein